MTFPCFYNVQVEKANIFFHALMHGLIMNFTGMGKNEGYGRRPMHNSIHGLKEHNIMVYCITAPSGTLKFKSADSADVSVIRTKINSMYKVTHPTTNLSQCCLTSKIDFSLTFQLCYWGFLILLQKLEFKAYSAWDLENFWLLHQLTAEYTLLLSMRSLMLFPCFHLEFLMK